jgi:hypothetical protein
MHFDTRAASLAVAGLLLAGPAEAAVLFSGSATGSWVNSVAGSDNPHPDVTTTNADSTGVATFDFGIGDGTPPNIFTFDGAGSNTGSAVPAFSNVAAGTQFDIGHFTYYNGNTTAGTAVDSVSLSISLNLTSPTGASPDPTSYSYGLSIDITPNTTGNAVTDGDIVTILNGVTSGTFTADGVTYTLFLEGFSTDGGQTFTQQFLSPEESTAQADIYAIIQQPSLIPEPVSLSLLGSGMFVMGVLRRRRGG